MLIFHRTWSVSPFPSRTYWAVPLLFTHIAQVLGKNSRWLCKKWIEIPNFWTISYDKFLVFLIAHPCYKSGNWTSFHENQVQRKLFLLVWTLMNAEKCLKHSPCLDKVLTNYFIKSDLMCSGGWKIFFEYFMQNILLDRCGSFSHMFFGLMLISCLTLLLTYKDGNFVNLFCWLVIMERTFKSPHSIWS